MADNVDFKHPQYADNLPDWEKINDVCSGQRKFKTVAFKKRYLLRLSPQDTSERNTQLNEQYLERAVLYPFVSHTLKTLTGLAFSKPPKIDLQTSLEYIKSNADGTGVGLTQQMKDSFNRVMKVGRLGLYVDIETNGDGSQATMPKAFINQVSAMSAINWRDGGEMIVIKESVPDYGDFEIEYIDQWRVLMMVSGVYTIQLYRKSEDFYLYDTIIPTDYNGNTFSQVLFQWVGSESNNSEVDQAPLLELANISIAHFRDSADYQHSTFWAGQPQAVMSGLNQNWLENVLKVGAQDAFQIGSSEVLPLPENGEFNYVQAQPNSMPMESMAHHRDLIISLGGKLIEKGTQSTRIEAADNAQSEHSVLSLVADNVEQAYNNCLEWVSLVMGSNQDSSVELNKDLINRELTSQELKELVEANIKGALPKSDMITKLQRHGLINPEKTLEEVLDELEVNAGGLG